MAQAGVAQTASCWYDAFANLDCVTTDAGSPADCNQSGHARLLADYTYDYLDRLEALRTFTASGSAELDTRYHHDVLDRVVSQTETHHSASAASRTTAFTHLGLGGLVTSETHTAPSGAALGDKAYGYDAHGHRLTMTDQPANGSEQLYTYGYDAHGSVSLLLDDAGAPKAAYGYRAYGEADEALTVGDTDLRNPLNAYRYTAKRYDSGSATLDMGARRFAPDTSRFLQQDLYLGALDDLGLSLDPLTNNRYSLAGGNWSCPRPPARVCLVHQPSKATPPCLHNGQRSGRGIVTRPRRDKNSSRGTSTANTINNGCPIQPTALGRLPASRGPTNVQDRDILAVIPTTHKPTG